MKRLVLVIHRIGETLDGVRGNDEGCIGRDSGVETMCAGAIEGVPIYLNRGLGPEITQRARIDREIDLRRVASDHPTAKVAGKSPNTWTAGPGSEHAKRAARAGNQNGARPVNSADVQGRRALFAVRQPHLNDYFNRLNCRENEQGRRAPVDQTLRTRMGNEADNS